MSKKTSLISFRKIDQKADFKNTIRLIKTFREGWIRGGKVLLNCWAQRWNNPALSFGGTANTSQEELILCPI